MQVLHSGVYLHFYMHYTVMHLYAIYMHFWLKEHLGTKVRKSCLECTKACTLAF